MFEDKPDILSIKDAAGILGLSNGTMYKLVSKGEVPSRRVGHKIIITKKNLISYVEQTTNSPQQQADSSVGKVVRQ